MTAGTRTAACSIRRLLHHVLLALVVVHAQKDEVHFLEDLEVHVDDLLAVERAFQEGDELPLLQQGLNVLEYLTQLERIAVYEVLGERQRVVDTSGGQQLLVLLEPVLKKYIFSLRLQICILSFDVVCELDELLREHLIEELLQCLVLLA